MDEHGMAHVPLIGNVFVLNARTARVFHERRIPGITLTAELLAACERQSRSPDGGSAFFTELAAKQAAIYRGLGFRGIYLGGVHDLATMQRIRDIERRFAPDDWQGFAREVRYSQPGEFFFYPDDATAVPAREGKGSSRPGLFARHVGPLYPFWKWVHAAMFTPGRPMSRLGAWLTRRAKDPRQGPLPIRALERVSKTVMFRCKDCGDCSLPEIAFLCPESQCAKNQRNGPCGGTRAGACEVDGYGDCIWVRAYERRKHDGTALSLLRHAPVIQDQGLRGTSSWANTWQGRDHVAKPGATAPPEGR
jgi:methylenetetrahydrofolate reductase (NADPH)